MGQAAEGVTQCEHAVNCEMYDLRGLGEATDFEQHLLLLQQHFTGIQSFVYVTYIHKRSKK